MYWTRDVGEDLRVRGRVKEVKLIRDKVANRLGLRGANLVYIQTGSTVHWRLAFITMGDYARLRAVKYWDSNSMGDEGGRQRRIEVNSDGFLRRRAEGASTPDLIVMEFRMVCRQTDLASA